jgi:ubiquinone/menaquinone biosynthesis C-methylase UbiE
MSAFSHRRVIRLPKCFWLHDECFAIWLGSHLTPLGNTICDVGAGDGFMLARFCKIFSKVVAVEPSPSAIQVLKKRTFSRPVRIIHGKAESIPLPDNVVDIAIAKSSFHHFESMNSGLREMRRIARNAVAVAEVIAPSVSALKFAKKILIHKEPDRSKAAVFSENDLKSYVAGVARNIRCLHFDQYIDVKTWLLNSDLGRNSQLQIYRYIANQTGTVKNDMQIHFQKGRLVMLRRMALVIGLLA